MEMIRKISKFFAVPENNIHIISGLTSRKKIDYRQALLSYPAYLPP